MSTATATKTPAVVETKSTESVKPAKSSKKKAKASRFSPAALAMREKLTHNTGAKLSDARPGVVAIIRDMLRKASKTKPVSKDAIHAKLVKTFPERDAAKLRNTVNARVPSGLYHAGDEKVKIESNDDGYWMV